MVPIDAKILMDGIWPAVPAHKMVTAVVTDNREVVEDCIFVAIKGERVDGHTFAKAAIEQGALAVVAQHPVEDVPLERTVLVRDPLDTMIAMGANYRNHFSPLILAITGSVGKTTCKEFCAAVFSAFGNTLKTQGNQNNEIGLPKTIFNMTDDTRYAVLEMGMQNLGEIHKLTIAARPNAAIITKIGTAHIRQLGSVENICAAKMEICNGLAQGSPLILNGDDPMLCNVEIPSHVRAVYAGIENDCCEVVAKNITECTEGQNFTIVDKKFGDFEAFIPAFGYHNVENALLAYTATTRLGLSAEMSAKALKDYKTTGMRQNIVDMNGITLIEDCYNANPDSMLAALLTLAQVGKSGRRIAMLGDMLDLGPLGEEAHREVGRICSQVGVDLLFTVGELSAQIAEQAQILGVNSMICDNNKQAGDILRLALRKGDTVLFKASRGMHFEEIIDVITGQK